MDCQLVSRFVRERDTEAFARLLDRYAAMVHGVCRRVLGQRPEADDAFQATFLVLLRRAETVVNTRSLGSWLYAVASRTALKARSIALRRQVWERELPNMLPQEAETASAWQELRPILDHELSKLPEKYRSPLVLCYLQGKTQLEAARELGWPSGSMSRRLVRGRELLRKRLLRRGITLSLASLLFLLEFNARADAAPLSLTSATERLVRDLVASPAAASIPAQVHVLAESAIEAMTVARLHLVLKGLVVVLLVGIIVGSSATVADNVLQYFLMHGSASNCLSHESSK